MLRLVRTAGRVLSGSSRCKETGYCGESCHNADWKITQLMLLITFRRVRNVYYLSVRRRVGVRGIMVKYKDYSEYIAAGLAGAEALKPLSR
jgi:hypothetical protein